ncbi:Crp/Fnr family transcriptional regulator [Oceanobacillus zhaokaii]|uniref:Crp/Fnr family transcriptional regulator n=1 Tax=Oceanobacillus zhaokaii TaxID=2052660 RepID=A0A345PL57_9BACI|nr:TQO small subunit DoxD [Oceanobacillus zhaokaii]AXI10737.1 Crp/Fnr family transcriptional regulator [Oceanobacillus zhaokaii]
MIMEFIRNNKFVAGVLAILRIYIGYTWLMGGLGKVTSGGFDASGFIQGAIANSTGEGATVQAWWGTFLETVALPNVGLFSFLVMWGEILVGAALILGVFTNFAALMGITMNFAFLFSGTVSTNAQMVLITVFLIIAGYNAGRYGLDRWVLPILKNHTPIAKEKEKVKKEVVVA